MIAVTVLGSGMAFLDGTVVNVALPDIGRDLHASTSALPASASAACAASLSRRVPPKDTSTSVAKPPKAANVAIWTLPITSRQKANTPGTTIAARIARIAAGTDHTGRQ